MRFLFNIYFFLKKTKKFYNIKHSVLMPGWLNKDVYPIVCKFANFLCRDVLSIVSDGNVSLDNTERMDVIMAHYPR
jgi:hypothetical protein